MSETGVQNRFAPPRAIVEDHVATDVEMVDATRKSRLLAVIVDCLPAIALGAVAGIAAAVCMGMGLTGGASGKGMSIGFALLLAVVGVALVGYLAYNGVLVYRYGQTFGKRRLGIRVVRTDGSRVGFARFVFLRWLGLAIAFGILVAIAHAVFGLTSAHRSIINNTVWLVDALLIFRASRRCLHDVVADTKVVTAATSENATLAGFSGAHLRTIRF